MGLRFRKSFKIAPGVKLNFGKRVKVLHLEGKEFITLLIQKVKQLKVLVSLEVDYTILKHLIQDPVPCKTRIAPTHVVLI